ncbi:MAG: hypothetical protein K2O89_00765 [Clostridia bacterium]|nr:hypothetical protein [Clostridia bacterium]
MLKTLLINLARGLLINVFAAAASFGILYLAYWLNIETWPEYFSIYLLMFIAAVISVALIVVLFVLAKVFNWRFIFGIETIKRYGKGYWQDRIKNNKPLKAWKLRTVLLIHLLLCAVAVVVFVFTRETLEEQLLTTASDKMDVIKLLLALSVLVSVAFVQFIYFVAMRSHYKKAKCRKCKNIFCIVDVGIDYENSTTDFKFANDHVSVSGYYFDRDGRMNFTGGKAASSRKITHKDICYNTKCLVCGCESYRYDSKTIKDNWVEGERY